MFTPILAHGADLVVLPFLVAGILTIMIALKDGHRKRPSTFELPAASVGRQVRAAMRTKGQTRPATHSPRPATHSPRPAHPGRASLQV
ncbi:MAG: hypothetical protein ACRDYV_23205, partial [Acidimicrobiia bacterium]